MPVLASPSMHSSLHSPLCAMPEMPAPISFSPCLYRQTAPGLREDPSSPQLFLMNDMPQLTTQSCVHSSVHRRYKRYQTAFLQNIHSVYQKLSLLRCDSYAYPVPPQNGMKNHVQHHQNDVMILPDRPTHHPPLLCHDNE